MAHYATCLNCANDKFTCERRIALREALKGSHVYSIKFKCPERRAYFTPGQRIAFDWKSFDSDGYDESCLHLTFTGTVIKEKGSKFIVQVDSGLDTSGEGIEASDVFKKNDKLLIKVRPADMRPLHYEPSRAVCQTCYHVEGNAESRCYQNGTEWTPNGCILAPRKDVADDFPF